MHPIILTIIILCSSNAIQRRSVASEQNPLVKEMEFLAEESKKIVIYLPFSKQPHIKDKILEKEIVEDQISVKNAAVQKTSNQTQERQILPPKNRYLSRIRSR